MLSPHKYFWKFTRKNNYLVFNLIAFDSIVVFVLRLPWISLCLLLSLFVSHILPTDLFLSYLIRCATILVVFVVSMFLYWIYFKFSSYVTVSNSISSGYSFHCSYKCFISTARMLLFILVVSAHDSQPYVYIGI